MADGPLGWIFGADSVLVLTIVNATGDAISAGWWAVAVLVPLLFLDPGTRAMPSRVLVSLAEGGSLLSRLFLLLFAVSIIAAFLNESGLTGELTRAVTSWLEKVNVLRLFGFEIPIVGGVYLMLALVCAMLCAILLGMGMPTVPAYVNVALLLGPLLANLGVSFFTLSHGILKTERTRAARILSEASKDSPFHSRAPFDPNFSPQSRSHPMLVELWWLVPDEPRSGALHRSQRFGTTAAQLVFFPGRLRGPILTRSDSSLTLLHCQHCECALVESVRAKVFAGNGGLVKRKNVGVWQFTPERTS